MANTDTGERMALVERVVEDHVAETRLFPTTNQIVDALDGAAGGKDAVKELLDLMVKGDRLAIGHESPGNPTIYMPKAGHDAVLRSQRPPDWMDDYSFEEVDRIKARIREQEQQLTDYHLIESLLYGTGRGLEEAVARALEILEFQDLDAPYEDPESWDVSFTYEGDTWVIDVKGKGKPADKRDAGQLQQWMEDYVEKHPDTAADRVKGALVINHYKHLDPKERWPDNPEFPPVTETCERHLKLGGRLFLTTPDLFRVTRKVQRGELTPEQGRKEVMSLFRKEVRDE